MPHTTSVTELQRNFRHVIKKAKRLKQPMVVMSRNQPSFVIIDYSKYQELQSKINKQIYQDLNDDHKLMVSDKADRREMYMDLFGVWTQKDFKEFEENTKDLEKVDPEDWI